MIERISVYIIQARNAAKYGATALLLFSDPHTDTREGKDTVYPDSWWLPTDGVQRGALRKNRGDSLTPGYPAKGQGHFIHSILI